MGRRRARETKDQEMAAPSAPDAKKKKNSDGAPGAGVCNDVLDNIFARLPTRSAIASMVLSKHHHRLICSTEFRNLHFHLGARRPNPNIAYLVTERDEHKDDEFQSFHIAGAGVIHSNAPMRTLAGEKLHEMKYVNTCNGILLFAGDTNSKTSTCILWNPAIAEKEVSVPYTVNQDPDDLFEMMTGYDYSILGLGYGPRSKTYKLLLSLRVRLSRVLQSAPPQKTYDRELLVYTLGVAGEQPRFVTLLWSGRDRKIRRQSLYVNGVIYFMSDDSDIHAFDIDNETITEIDVPGSDIPRNIVGELGQDVEHRLDHTVDIMKEVKPGQ
ncbi:hypothetical protein PR202_gb14521 [Eleusine coracana subsp. coracana]|uniref:F-box associated beta-propeller type 3 domain-containing protein n=1 Tax=Eleusine coracana subsp. coracana TaxID=191504 RepID=A0AAV5ET60_ELECO|nr:hypothetical protein PR202_gb14521 [Eleusine coracana subsp. coracana]